VTRILRQDPFDFRNLSPAVRMLLIANLVGFVAGLIVPEIRTLFGLVPEQVIFQRWLWQPFTYLFLQGSLLGLVFNLIGIWMFGRHIEEAWGEREFLKYYFMCGLSTAAVHLGAAPHSSHAVIGASGPMFGLLTAFAMLHPDEVIHVYFMIPVRAAHVAIFYGLFALFSGLSGETAGPARFAGLSGMAVGYVYIRWWWEIKIQLKALWRRASSAQPEEEPAPRVIPRRSAVKPKPKAPAVDDMAEVDRILDKILSDGLESLTDDEKGVMHKYSERNKPS